MKPDPFWMAISFSRASWPRPVTSPLLMCLPSASRVMNAITTEDHRAAVNKARALMSKYEDIELLVKVGEYKQGADPLADEAIRKIESIRAFLKQRTDELVPLKPDHRPASANRRLLTVCSTIC